MAESTAQRSARALSLSRRVIGHVQARDLQRLHSGVPVTTWPPKAARPGDVPLYVQPCCPHVTEAEMAALRSLDASLAEGGGYTIEPALLDRLLELGAVRRHVGDICSVTEFGACLVNPDSPFSAT